MATRDILYAAAGGSAAPTYIEDVFSTWLYTGTGANLTINNGIDLAGKGGMTWFKGRNTATSHALFDTNRGAGYSIYSNATSAQSYFIDDLSSFTSTGFTLGDSATSGRTNASGYNYCSWTFRKQPKFFDVVTYTGNGTAGRTVAHNLGSVPGMMIIKSTNSTYGWFVYHRSVGATKYLLLNTTDAEGTASSVWNNTSPTSTEFTLGDAANVNGSGVNFVAYLFAHNAGGFGLTGTDNVISCGSFVQGAGTTTTTLGYEPQYVLVKDATTGGDWWVVDNMRNFSVTSFTPLRANLSNAEVGPYAGWSPTATGFTTSTDTFFSNGSTYIYMAIRRGPMKTPTTATTVFNPVFGTTNLPAYSSPNFNSGIDCSISFYTPGYDDGTYAYPNFNSRLQGTGQVQSPNPRAEVGNGYNTWDFMNGYYSLSGVLNSNWGAWMFRRAPGFMDVVCYTGTGATPQNVTHNLGVAPELMFVKVRSAVRAWAVYAGNAGQYLTLNATDAVTSNTNVWGSTAPTSSVFRVGNFSSTNPLGEQIVAYLFATVAGVSKVGSYTGTGSTLNINAGLPTGARFVLIKRTDSTGDWWTWDTVRGMVAGTDPRIPLNAAVAQTNANWVYTATNGFQIVTSDATVNASGGSYIYLAIA